MKSGVNIQFFSMDIGMEKAAELAAKAGFQYLDYTPPVELDDWKDLMKADLKIFKDNGLSVHQTHAPFNRYGRCGSADKHKLYMSRCMEATAFMGASYMAVHGDEFDLENPTNSVEALLAYNHDYFAPYVAEGEKTGVKLAFETVFKDSPERKRFTDQPEELMALILSFGSENAVCCWDFGHAHVSFPDTAVDWIVKFGSLIQCTHLHDNTGIDSHQLPLTGDIDWNRTMGAFKEIGYDGVMSIEYSHGHIPEGLALDFLTLTQKTVEYLGNL